MRSKKPRRQSSRYLKLYAYEPYAVTWFEGADKVAHLCETIEQATKYLDRYRSERDKIKIEHEYISRPIYGLILHDSDKMPLLDAWTGKPNTNKLSDSLTLKRANYARIKGTLDNMKKVRAELDKIDGLITDGIYDMSIAKSLRLRALGIASKLDSVIDNIKDISN